MRTNASRGQSALLDLSSQNPIVGAWIEKNIEAAQEIAELTAAQQPDRLSPPELAGVLETRLGLVVLLGPERALQQLRGAR